MELKAEYIRKQEEEEESIKQQEEESKADSLDFDDNIDIDDDNLDSHSMKSDNSNSIKGSEMKLSMLNIDNKSIHSINDASSKESSSNNNIASTNKDIQLKENEIVVNETLTTTTSTNKKKKDIAPLPFTQIIPGLYYDIKDFPLLEIESPLSHNILKDSYTEYMDTSHHFYDIYPEERLRDISRPSYNALLPGERPITPDSMKTPPPPMRTYLSPIYPLAYKKLVQLQIMMPGLYMSVAQLTILLEYFPPDEAFLRIHLIQSVFSHIVDLEQMYRIYDNILSEDERIEVVTHYNIININYIYLNVYYHNLFILKISINIIYSYFIVLES